jgi:hypothetical protein
MEVGNMAEEVTKKKAFFEEAAEAVVEGTRKMAEKTTKVFE